MFLVIFKTLFLAMRGSIRKRITVATDGAISTAPLVVNLLPDSALPTAVSMTTGIANNLFPNLHGGDTFVPLTNGGIEFELPFYSNNYYYFASSATYSSPNCAMFETTGSLLNYIVQFFVPGTPANVTVSEQTATGEDFQLTYWLGAVPYVAH